MVRFHLFGAIVAISLEHVLADDCLAAINKYRNMAGKSSIGYCEQNIQSQAQTEAEWDDAHGFHNYVKTKGWKATCSKLGSGQCECGSGVSSWDACVNMYYKEGPPKGGGYNHYSIMMSDKAHCVACGVAKDGFRTNNLCGEGGQGPSPGPSPPGPSPPGPSPPGPSPPGPSPSGQGLSIRAGSSSKCLDLPGGNTQNGNLLWLWGCNGSPHQSWIFDANTWKIRYQADPSKCIDLPGGDNKDGNRLQIWDCNGQQNQKWGYDSTEKTIYLAWPNHVKCIDVNWGDKSALHTLVQIWDCNGHSNQQWTLASGSAQTTMKAFNISSLVPDTLMDIMV